MTTTTTTTTASTKKLAAAAAATTARRGVIEALVEVQGQVHEVSVKLADCASFADLSQRVHEACEDAGLPRCRSTG